METERVSLEGVNPSKGTGFPPPSRLLYQILPNVALVVAIAGLVIILAKRLPEARRLVEDEALEKRDQSVLPEDADTTTSSRLFSRIVFYFLKLWHWMLEAKDLKPGAVASYRMKKVIKKTAKPKEVKPKEVAVEAPQAVVVLPRVPIDELTEDQVYELLKDTPKDTQLLGRLSQLYMDEERYAEAAEVFEYILTLEPGEPRHYAKLGFCNFQLEQFASSINNYEKSIALDPAHPNRYYNLALAYEMLKNWTQARKAFKKAIELDPENAKYKIALNTLNRNLRETRKNSL